MKAKHKVLVSVGHRQSRRQLTESSSKQGSASHGEDLGSYGDGVPIRKRT